MIFHLLLYAFAVVGVIITLISAYAFIANVWEGRHAMRLQRQLDIVEHKTLNNRNRIEDLEKLETDTYLDTQRRIIILEDKCRIKKK